MLEILFGRPQMFSIIIKWPYKLFTFGTIALLYSRGAQPTQISRRANEKFWPHLRAKMICFYLIIGCIYQEYTLKAQQTFWA